MKTGRTILLLSAATALVLGICAAQNFGGGGRGFGGGQGFGGGGFGGGRGGRGRYARDIPPIVHDEGGDEVNEDTVRTARETSQHSDATPDWTNQPGFEQDVFTFTRIIYKFENSPGPGWLAWVNDYPDADLNLSYRLQQMTSLHVNPDGRVIKLTNSDLLNYPFIYAVKPGRLELRDEEVPILRNYLLNGGFLMADDFWGDREWENFEREMKRVLPGRNWVELPMDHPLFHCLFDIKADKQKLQVPNIHTAERNFDPATGTFNSSSSRRGPDMQQMHIRAWLDDKQRFLVIATHNTDNGDGWERESEFTPYFQTFSEQRAYPIGFNIIYYVMTH